MAVTDSPRIDNASDPRDNRGSRQYNLTSIPQPGMNNRRVPLGMGFCVGGSSAINGMAVMRGTVADYAIWAELGSEDSTWDWDGMLPYFRKVGWGYSQGDYKELVGPPH